MKRPKIVLGLLATLAMLISMFGIALPVAADPTFTGDVEFDFPTGPDILTFVDPGGKDVLLDGLVPPHPIPGTSSGWDIKDVRLTYNSTTDILYVGLNSYETVGDADTDGNEGLKSYGTGVDVLNLGLGEYVTVYFDLDQDGDWDVIAGVPDTTDFSGFTVNTALGTTAAQAFFGATNLSATHLGDVFWDVSAGPDLEFEIENFSLLPGQGGQLSAFTIGANMGSGPDVDIIEDVMIGSTSPAINIVKTTNGADGPLVSVGDPITWQYVVTSNVTLSNVTVTDSVAGVNPAYVSGDTGNLGFLDPTETWIYEAYGTATVGPYTNTGTATGYLDGFPVSATDPSSYRTSQEVGGTAFPVDKLKLLVPWAVLLACAGVVTLFMLRKRREA